MSEPIRIFVTGGTFDKEYNERTGELYFKDTHLPEMLRLGRSRVEVTIRTIMMIDSLEMTDADRALIVQNCLQSPEDGIVITHGTDTMTETAAAVARAVSARHSPATQRTSARKTLIANSRGRRRRSAGYEYPASARARPLSGA